MEAENQAQPVAETVIVKRKPGRPRKSEGAMPMALTQQSVKRPKWHTSTLQMRYNLHNALAEFCKNGGYEQREVIDVALRNYLHLEDPTDDEL